MALMGQKLHVTGSETLVKNWWEDASLIVLYPVFLQTISQVYLGMDLAHLLYQ